MARNGSGTYSFPNPTFVTGTPISSSAVNANQADLATEITNSLPRDGQAAPTANIPMGNFKFTGLGAGSAATDSLTLSQAQAAAFAWCTVGGTADAITLTCSPVITAYAAGQTFRFVAGADNTGAVTIAVSGLATKALKKVTGGSVAALVAGDLREGNIYQVTYDGTQFKTDCSVGEIKGPDSSTDGAVALFDGTTGTILKNGYVLGTSANNVVQLDGSAKLPAVDGSQLLYVHSFFNTQVFTGNGTYTPTAGMAYVVAEIVGGGGGGGGTNTNNTAGGGGGGGGYAKVILTAAEIGASQAITIGAAGAAGADTGGAGGNGGTSSIGTLVSCAGGSGGAAGAAGGNNGGAGGAATVTTGTAIHTATGQAGGYSFAATGLAISGEGGSSLLGAGGNTISAAGVATAGASGTGKGSGGSGAARGTAGSGVAGGAGSAGYIIITEY